jgi:hypothetical protein
MRHAFFFLGALLILATGLAAPATAAAASVQSSSYTYTIRHDRCNGPTYETIHFEATEAAAGSTPANSLTIDSWAEEFSHGAWHTAYVWPEQHKNFTANGTSHSLTSSRSFGDSPHSVRIAMQLKIWKNGSLLSHKVFLSGTC